METIASFEELIQAIRLELRGQAVAVKELAVAIAESEKQIDRRDQISRLGILKSRVIREIKDIERMELAAQSSDNNITLFGRAPAAFTFYILLANAIGLKNAPQFGLKSMLSTLVREKPFGTVLIAVGKGDLPDDLTVIPVSRLARESNRNESEVEDSLKSDGYLLMTPEQFAELLDKVKCGILDGSYFLPIGIDRLSLLIP